jgi:hypothetical protein
VGQKHQRVLLKLGAYTHYAEQTLTLYPNVVCSFIFFFLSRTLNNTSSNGSTERIMVIKSKNKNKLFSPPLIPLQHVQSTLVKRVPHKHESTSRLEQNPTIIKRELSSFLNPYTHCGINSLCAFKRDDARFKYEH